MIDLKDMFKPPVILAMAGSAALGFAAGFLLGRDPQLMRRVLGAAAQGWEQARMALAETSEEIADQWAEAREVSRQAAEDAAFAATVATAAAASAVDEVAEPAPAKDAAGEPASAAAKPAKRRRRAAASRRSGARNTRITH